MKRPRIEIPERFPHETRLRVRISDVNYGGHLGNDALLSLLQEARLAFLATFGCSETDASGKADARGAQAGAPAGPGLILTDAVLLYRAQAYHGDEIRIRTAPAELARTGFRLVHQVVHADTGREIARAAIGLAFFDYAAGRPARMPGAPPGSFLLASLREVLSTNATKEPGG